MADIDFSGYSFGGFYTVPPELLPSRNPSTNRKPIEKDRTFSRFALSFYSLYYTSAASEQSMYYMSMGPILEFARDSFPSTYSLDCRTKRRRQLSRNLTGISPHLTARDLSNEKYEWYLPFDIRISYT